MVFIAEEQYRVNIKNPLLLVTAWQSNYIKGGFLCYINFKLDY